jgi:hypothetical protein
MVVGGGVRGKGAGIARGTIVQVGTTIETFHLFIERYHQVGGMTIGGIGGKIINGTPNEYPTKKFNKTGATGKRTDIGRSKILGVSKIWNTERTPNNKIATFNHNPGQNPERRSSNMTLSLDMEILIEEEMTNVTERRVTNVTEGRMTKRLSHYEKAAEKDLVTKLVNDINGVKGVNNRVTIE